MKALRRPGVFSVLFVSAMITGALLGILYFGWRAAGLPFVPFDTFDWLTRVLPGRIIAFGIGTMVTVIRALHLGPTSATAKMAEQAMAIVGLLIPNCRRCRLVRRRSRDAEPLQRTLGVGARNCLGSSGDAGQRAKKRECQCRSGGPCCVGSGSVSRLGCDFGSCRTTTDWPPKGHMLLLAWRYRQRSRRWSALIGVGSWSG